jgi:molybdate transport repressor ModE-like protein
MQINNLNIVPNWRFEDIEGNKLHDALIPLLESINKTKKLTVSAKECDLSYRHAWNILQEAETFFGSSVTYMERGRGASLTPLGQVLLQANQRIDARLHTQMESLAMELNSNVHRVLSDQVRVMTIYASHGYGVALVPKHIKGYQAEMHYHGPEDSLRALHAGSCKVAGFNLPLHHQIGDQQQRYQTLLSADKVKIIRFIKRQQGLMVSQENPKAIQSLSDVNKNGCRFINRQPLSGTRELLDQLLLDEQIDSQTIVGYDQYEYTHTAVAAQVATGMADVGFGVQAAAAKFDLDFIPVTEDTYLWAYQTFSEQDPEVIAFIEMLKSSEFQDEVNQLAGYACDDCGELAPLNAFMSE